jgi:glycosyltransferase involved in cell wall biosynthesis
VRLPGPSNPHALYRKDFSPDFVEECLQALDALRQHAQSDSVISIVELPNWAEPAISCRDNWGWKTVYDCLDEHSGFSSPGAGHIESEAELIAQSDLVLATSQLLFEKVRRQARRAMLLPNAADFDHFKSPGAARPLDGLSRPIIGYYGAIADWFDTDMVRAAAEMKRDWQFILIGSTHGADVSPLKRLRNVHLLGELPYGVLPAYLHQFDVACIPFKVNPLTLATSPVKFYEYLSAGKPVVSVPLPELEQFEEFYYPAETAREFVSQVEAALGERSHQKRLARIELAGANTWHHRYRHLIEAIESL